HDLGISPGQFFLRHRRRVAVEQATRPSTVFEDLDDVVLVVDPDQVAQRQVEGVARDVSYNRRVLADAAGAEVLARLAVVGVDPVHLDKAVRMRVGLGRRLFLHFGLPPLGSSWRRGLFRSGGYGLGLSFDPAARAEALRQLLPAVSEDLLKLP